MDNKEEEFLKRLQAMFKIEAEEHVESLLSGLIELEKRKDTETSMDIIEIINIHENQWVSLDTHGL